MKHIYQLFLLMSIGFIISCEDIQNIPELGPTTQSGEPVLVETGDLPEEAVRLFIASVSKTLKPEPPFSYNLSPVHYNGKVVLWIVNYPDEGYAILSGNKEDFPIIRYSKTGNFSYDHLPDEEKEAFDQLVEKKYQRMTTLSPVTRLEETPANSQVFDIWDDILEIVESKEEGVEYEIDIEFATEDQETVSTRSPGGPGTIPDRDYRKGYTNVGPLFPSNGREWYGGNPYNFNMIQKDKSYFGNGGAWDVPSFVVGLALIMDYHQLPDEAFWNRQPNKLTAKQQSELSKFFQTMVKDLHCLENGIHGVLMRRTKFDSHIPTVLSNKYGFDYQSAKPTNYFPDQAGFDQVRLHVQRYHPVLFLPDGLEGYAKVIDGVAEFYTKVTTKKKVLGITTKKKVKYYYCDYFHLVYPHNRKHDGWVLYDSQDSEPYKNYRYMFFLKRKAGV